MNNKDIKMEVIIFDDGDECTYEDVTFNVVYYTFKEHHTENIIYTWTEIVDYSYDNKYSNLEQLNTHLEKSLYDELEEIEE